MFGKKNHLVGLDIGSRSIKVGEVTDTGKGRSISKFGVIDIPHGSIEEGSIKEPEVVADLIRRLFKSKGIKEQNVAVSVGGYSVIVKKINVQPMTEEQLQATIQFEAEQYIPFDIRDVNLDFQILGEAEGNPNLMSVLLVAAKKEIVSDYVNLIQLSDLTPAIIDIDAFALQNIFELNYDLQDENIALVDIGASKTSLNILKGASSLFMRDVSLGCSQINQKIISLADCSVDEAEKLKHGGETDKLKESDLLGIVTSVVSDWCLEIRRAMDFFYSTYPDDQINRIVLSGGGANIEEFRNILAAETSAEVEKINPFAGFDIGDKRLDSGFVERIAPQAAICLGLAIRRVDDK